MSQTGVSRLWHAILLVFVMIIASPGAAVAKTPQFTVELAPTAPTDGEPVTVIVRFDAYSPPAEDVNKLLAFVPGSGTDGSRMPVSLARTSDGSYRGQVVLPQGSWTLIRFPGNAYLESAPGAPESIALTVAPAAAPAATRGATQGTTQGAEPIWALVAAVAVAAALLVRRRRSTPRIAGARQGACRTHYAPTIETARPDEPAR
jgi:hypothetical protein